MTSTQELEIATLGGGCFWCVEAIYQDVIGVEKVVSGYAGGHVPHPTYEAVCAGITGHAEVIQVYFDTAVITYEEILFIFWRVHDPTTLNRQGADVGTQYRSVILYADERQKEVAARSLQEVVTSGLYASPIVTEIAPLGQFYAAEKYHQNYYRTNPNQPYCRAVIDPKVRKFRQSFQAKLRG
jgi:peptide-methionine (S)-S-oxide reductase